MDRSNLDRHFTASAFVLNSQREILLLRHRKLGVWLYPGGHIEINETPDDAVRREVREETGLHVELVGERDEALADRNTDVTVLHRPYQVLCEFINDKESPHYHIDLIYLCWTCERALPNQREIDDADFFNRRRAGELRLFPNFTRMLNGLFDDESVWRVLGERHGL